MNETLEHHGILGMKWGVRRYQNKDGTLTEEGKEHRAEEKPLFTKEELDAAKSRNMDNDGDWAINDAMFIEVADHYFPNGIKTDSRWAQEFYKFCDDPHKYMESVKKQKEYWSIPTPERAKTPLADSLADTDEYKEYVNSYKKLDDQFQRDGKNSKDVEDHYVDALDKATNKALELSREYFGMHDIGYGPAGELVWDRLRLDTENETKHSDDSSEDILEHHGILGMKWGVRRYQNKDGSLTPAGRKRYGDDIPDGNKSSGNTADATPRTPAKPASEMTDQELNQALNRLRMEQQYNEMTGAKSQNNYQNQKDYLNPPSNTWALSNAELQSYITRLELEKRYSTLTAPPPKKVGWGEKFVKETLPAVAMEVAREYTKSAFKKMLGLSGDNNDGGNNQKNNDNGGKKKDDSALEKIRKQLNQSNQRMNAMDAAISSLDKSIKASSTPQSKSDKQKSDIGKDLLKQEKKAIQDSLKQEKKRNDELKKNSGYPTTWTYNPSGSDDYNYSWTYEVDRS